MCSSTLKDLQKKNEILQELMTPGIQSAKYASVSGALRWNQFHDQIYSKQTVKDGVDLEAAVISAANRGRRKARVT